MGPGPDPLEPEVAGQGPGKKVEVREPVRQEEELEQVVERAELEAQLAVQLAELGELGDRLEELVVEMEEEQAQAEGMKVEGPGALP